MDISSEAEFPADLVEALSGTHKFVDKIGAGAMGSVYRTRNILLERDEALKIISGNISPERLKRLRLEAQSLGKAAGIGIAAVYNIAVTKSGRPYILMEYLPGVSLRQVIKESFPLNPDLVALWMHQICFGIDQAHKMGIIHRDIKPDNILISKAAAGWEDAKVIDFGISRITDVQHELTLGNVSLGTPLYMSPEQFVDGAELTYKADIYSLGCVLYEMLTGGGHGQDRQF